MGLFGLKMRLILQLSLAAFFLIPNKLSATTITFGGQVNSDQTFGPALAPDRSLVGQAINASFEFDVSGVAPAGCLSFLGGTQCEYGISLKNYTLNVGNFSQNFSDISGNMYLTDMPFGDAAGFTFTKLGLGYYDSTLTGVQFQGRSIPSALSSAAFTPDFDFEKFEWSLFLTFQGGPERVDVRGPLAITISSISSVPEPSTWALYLFGIFYIARSIRARRPSFDPLPT